MVESVGNAPTSACLQGKCIACLPRPRLNAKCKMQNVECMETRRICRRTLCSAFCNLNSEQAALVLPQASGVLETLPHELVRDPFKWRIRNAKCRMVSV